MVFLDNGNIRKINTGKSIITLGPLFFTSGTGNDFSVKYNIYPVSLVMGRKTLESFPNGLPLKNRTNIVLTHDHTYKVPGAVVVHDMDELHEELKKYDSEDIYVIGGETIYRQLLDECDVAHITKIDYAYDADAYFPNLDEDPEWEMTKISDEQTYFDLEYVFTIYERR